MKITGVESDEEPFVVVEEMPVFPGGDEALLKYIVENVKYPEASKNNKTEGKVIVRFCVTAKGNVDKLSVLRGVADDIDAEALRVVKTLPDFKPGKQGGKEVPVWYMVPINFALK
jgi:protein TonB